MKEQAVKHQLAEDLETLADDIVDAKIEPHNTFDFAAAETEFAANQTPTKKMELTDDVDTTKVTAPDGTVTETDKSKIKVIDEEFVDQRAQEVAVAQIKKYNAAMKALEDERANHRNKNRMMMLLVALIMSFVLAQTLAMIYPPLLRFATPIALIPDLGLTIYAYLRKY